MEDKAPILKTIFSILFDVHCNAYSSVTCTNDIANDALYVIGDVEQHE